MDFIFRKPFLRRLAIGSAVVAVLTACGTAAFQHEESRLTFRVVRDTPAWYTGMPDGVQEFDLALPTANAVQHIHAWWWPAATGRADAPAVLYLHGARWSLTGQLFRIEELRDFGFSVLAIDYRGFGKSDGDTPMRTPPGTGWSRGSPILPAATFTGIRWAAQSPSTWPHRSAPSTVRAAKRRRPRVSLSNRRSRRSRTWPRR